MPSFKGSSQPRNGTPGLLILLYSQACSLPPAPPRKPKNILTHVNTPVLCFTHLRIYVYLLIHRDIYAPLHTHTYSYPHIPHPLINPRKLLHLHTHTPTHHTHTIHHIALHLGPQNTNHHLASPCPWVQSLDHHWPCPLRTSSLTGYELGLTCSVSPPQLLGLFLPCGRYTMNMYWMREASSSIRSRGCCNDPRRLGRGCAIPADHYPSPPQFCTHHTDHSALRGVITDLSHPPWVLGSALSQR